MMEKQVGIAHAAQYVRMSTEHQQYSTVNQQAKILEYARSNGLEVVKTYADEGRSGLRLNGRRALQALISDVTGGRNAFSHVLVYDVSRWGRFQDADESAHYEFICRQAGVQVVYCAEQFENDGSPLANIVKGLKRVMAGEYSRELSEKVFAGQARLVGMGYRVGARAGYGLRRALIGSDGKMKGLLSFGERKAIQSDRIALVPGPDEEIRIVQEIFKWFVHERLLYADIVRRLVSSGTPPPPGLSWTKSVVKSMLGNEKYAGHLVYNRTSNRLLKGPIKQPRDLWVRHDNALEPIIDSVTFTESTTLIARNPKRLTDDELLVPLQNLYRSAGHLTRKLVGTTRGMPSVDTYRNRFGSTSAAFAKVGFEHAFDYHTVGRKAQVTRARLRRCLDFVTHYLHQNGAQVTRIGELKLKVNRSVRVAFVSISLRRNRGGERLRLDPTVDAVVAVRFPDGDPEAEYFVIPRIEFSMESISISPNSKTSRLEPYICPRESVAATLASLRFQRRVECHPMRSGASH